MRQKQPLQRLSSLSSGNENNALAQPAGGNQCRTLSQLLTVFRTPRVSMDKYGMPTPAPGLVEDPPPLLPEVSSANNRSSLTSASIASEIAVENAPVAEQLEPQLDGQSPPRRHRIATRLPITAPRPPEAKSHPLRPRSGPGSGRRRPRRAANVTLAAWKQQHDRYAGGGGVHKGRGGGSKNSPQEEPDDKTGEEEHKVASAPVVAGGGAANPPSAEACQGEGQLLASQLGRQRPRTAERRVAAEWQGTSAGPAAVQRPASAFAFRRIAVGPTRTLAGEEINDESQASLRVAHAAVPEFPEPVLLLAKHNLTDNLPPSLAATLFTHLAPPPVQTRDAEHGHQQERADRNNSGKQHAASGHSRPSSAAPGQEASPTHRSSPRLHPRKSDKERQGVGPVRPPSSARRQSAIPRRAMACSRVSSDSRGAGGSAAGDGLVGEASVTLGGVSDTEPLIGADSSASLQQDLARNDLRRMTPESRMAWMNLFQRLANDGEVHRDILGRALELGGLPSPVQEWIDGVFDGMSRFTTLSMEEFLIFVESYLDKQHEEYTAAFKRFDDDGSGTIDQSELTNLLASLSIVPMKWVVQEILVEVAKDGSGSMNLDEFETTLKVLKLREGFSKFEYERIMAAFRLYDHDGSGTLDTRECIGLFGYLYYSLSPDAVRELVHDVDFDGSGQLNEREFLMCMRKAREYEVDRIQSALNFLLLQRRHPENLPVFFSGSGADEEDDMIPMITTRTESWIKLRLKSFTANDLSDFLRFFGIMAERDAVLEAIRDAGLELPMPEFGLDEAWRFLEVFRSREGFTRAEATDIEEAFRLHVPRQLQETRAIAELDRLCVGKALRWLGHEATFELQQLLIAEVDIDSKGFLGLPEFKKLIRKYRERELEEIKRALFSIGLFEMQQEGDGNQKIVSTHDYVAAMYWLGRRPSAPRRSSTKMDVEELEGGIMKQNGSLHQALEERRRVRMTFRENAGFSPQQVTDLQHKFQEFDTRNAGEVSKQQLRNLFEDLFPENGSSRQTRSAIVMLLREVDNNGDGALDFTEFLQLMGQANERHIKQKLIREQIAVEQTGFTPVEVKEFREIFLIYDTRGTDCINFKDIKAIMSRVVPMGDKFKSQLKDLCTEVLEGSHAPTPEFDFPAFLLLMRRVLDTDFGDMRAKIESQASVSRILPPTSGVQRRVSGNSSAPGPPRRATDFEDIGAGRIVSNAGYSDRSLSGIDEVLTSADDAQTIE